MTITIPLAVRDVLRQAFNALRWAPLLALWVVESGLAAAGRLERISTFLLCCAAPQIAGYLLDMEHSGRLDQMRLAGRAPGLVALRLIVVAGGPWIAAGVILLAWSAAIGERVIHPMVTIALIGAPTAIAALFTTRAFAKERIDPRILIAGLGLVGALFGILGQMRFLSAGGNVARTATLFAIGEVVIIAACLRGSMRRIAYPPASAARTGSAFHYRPEFLMRAPAMYRGAVLSASGYVLAVVFPPVIAISRGIVRDPEAITITPFLLPPVVIGGIAISLICREDAVLGRLDVVRQSAVTPSTTALQMIAGLWLPFVLSSVILAIIASTMFTIDPLEIALIVAGLLIVAPLPVVEGWSRLWPMTFMVPYLVAMAVPFRVGPLAQGVALVALLWWSAIRRFNDSDRPVLSGWAATAATAFMSAAPWSAVQSGGYIPEFAMVASSTALIATSPLLEPAAFKRRRDFWIRLASVTAAVTIVATASGFGWRDGVAAALATVSIWIASLRVRQSQVLRPAWQGAVRVVGMVVVAVVVAGPTPTRGGGAMQTVALTALGILIAVEAAHRAAVFVKRRATPRP